MSISLSYRKICKPDLEIVSYNVIKGGKHKPQKHYFVEDERCSP